MHLCEVLGLSEMAKLHYFMMHYYSEKYVENIDQIPNYGDQTKQRQFGYFSYLALHQKNAKINLNVNDVDFNNF